MAAITATPGRGTAASTTTTAIWIGDCSPGGSLGRTPAVNLQLHTSIPRTLCETTSGSLPVCRAPAARANEVTRPVDAPVGGEPGPSAAWGTDGSGATEADAPVARERGMSGRLLVGTDLRLDMRVGRGASAMVYRATRARGGPPVAVKVLHARSKASVRQRFHREVEILRQIDSPWVVKVAGKGVLPDGRPWYAMEYVDGQSLARILGNTPRSEPARVVGWLRGACRGLAAVHAAGWVHRDVKPANLVVLDMGDHEEVKIIDLGIAERIHAQPELLSGTPEYIAPEQAEFRPVDVRSDVYALGCCAYELLTGRRLVQGRTAIAKINAHIDGVRARWPKGQGIPYVLRRLVERCLARQPEARPPNMHALEAELEHVAQVLARMETRKTEPFLPPQCREVTELELGWPHTAANERPRPDPHAPVPVPRRRSSWSTLASTMLSAFTPRAARQG
jgi:serine/threonine protein kinase